MSVHVQFDWTHIVNELRGLGFTPYIEKGQLHIQYANVGICSIALVEKDGQLYGQWQKYWKNFRSLADRKPLFKKYWQEKFQQPLFLLEERTLFREMANIAQIFFQPLHWQTTLNEVKLTNYRCFTEQVIPFHDKITILRGGHGSGKTSVIESIELAMKALISHLLGQEEGMIIRKEDIRFMIEVTEGKVNYVFHTPTTVAYKMTVHGERYEWGRTRTAVTAPKAAALDANVLPILARQVNSELKEPKLVREMTLPLFAYFKSNRAVQFTAAPHSTKIQTPADRLYGYQHFASSDASFFLKWYKDTQRHGWRSEQAKTLLRTINRAIIEAVNRMEQREVKVTELLTIGQEMYLCYDDGNVVPFANLSAGYREIIYYVWTIAARMAILNPHLLDEVLWTPGIILIDEAELRLNQQWQQRLPEMLIMLFPRIQWIISTHSPILTEEAKQLGGTVVALTNEVNDYVNPLAPSTVESGEINPEHQQAIDAVVDSYCELVQQFLTAPSEQMRLIIGHTYERLTPLFKEEVQRKRSIDLLWKMLN